jgi:hypothetical protein
VITVLLNWTGKSPLRKKKSHRIPNSQSSKHFCLLFVSVASRKRCNVVLLSVRASDREPRWNASWRESKVIWSTVYRTVCCLCDLGRGKLFKSGPMNSAVSTPSRQHTPLPVPLLLLPRSPPVLPLFSSSRKRSAFSSIGSLELPSDNYALLTFFIVLALKRRKTDDNRTWSMLT